MSYGKNDKKTIARAYILMFISPPISLLSSLKSLNTNHRRWLLIVAGTLLSSTFLFDDIGDGVRHYEKVETYYTSVGLLEFIEETINIFTLTKSDNVKGDLYIHTISFISGSIIGYPPLFWTIVGFVYSFFYITSAFKIFYWYPNANRTFLFLFFFALFVSVKGFEGINTVRTWSGLWVMFYGIISFHQNKKLKYLILIFLCPPMFHFGYFALAIPVWVGFILNTDYKIIKLGLVFVFIISFFTTIEQAKVLEVTTQTDLGAQRTSSYYVEEAGNRPILNLKRLGTSNFYKAIHDSYLNFFFILSISSILILYGSYLRYFNTIESKLFSIGILTQAFSNVTTFLFAVSNRSAEIAILFLLASITLYIQRTYFGSSNHKFQNSERLLIIFFAACLSTIFLYKIAALFQWMSAYFFGLPIVPFIFDEINVTMKEVLDPLFAPL